MRDDYEISVAEIDTLVRIGVNHPDVYGARMTGGGFGGSVVMIAKAGRARAASRAIAEAYRVATGHQAHIIVPE